MIVQPSLFGSEAVLPRAALRPELPATQLDVFTVAAEHRALRSGRPRSQERTELIAGAGARCLLDHPLRLVRGRYTCETCDR